MAMPITKPGSISGDTRKVEIASRPGKRPRTRAMAQSVPSTMATAVETAATCSETTSAGRRPRVLASRSYPRSDQSGGGRAKTVEAARVAEPLVPAQRPVGWRQGEDRRGAERYGDSDEERRHQEHGGEGRNEP